MQIAKLSAQHKNAKRFEQIVQKNKQIFISPNAE
jgi:hypothetical protein